MEKNKQLKDDLKTLDIGENQILTKSYVNSKYKKMAKIVHPDKGGTDIDFQDLKNAYCRIIEYIENNQEKEAYEEEDNDYETEFFKKHNVLKECTSSFVLYIQNELASRWQRVFERHISLHSTDKCRAIFKTGEITLTLYVNPKKDPRSKIHIQGRNQKKNLDFIMEKLSMFYFEVCVMDDNASKAIVLKDLHRSHCIKCGKYFTNRRGLKQHVARMHPSTVKELSRTEKSQINSVILDEVMKVTRPSESISLSQSQRVITASPGELDICSPLRKKSKVERPEKEQTELIKCLLGEVLDTIPDNNYQCGECGKTFVEASQSDEHLLCEHAAPSTSFVVGQPTEPVINIDCENIAEENTESIKQIQVVGYDCDNNSKREDLENTVKTLKELLAEEVKLRIKKENIANNLLTTSVRSDEC